MLIYLLQLAAVAACASSGTLVAGKKNLDLIGVMVISVATAVGGGTVRDVLLDRNPVFWLADNTYVLVSLAAGLLTWAYTRRWPPPHRLLLTVDALGLALFTVAGIQIAQQAGQTQIVCLIMGVITGAAGGVVRDVLCGEIPLIFRRGELYASASALGGMLYLVLAWLSVGTDINTLITATLIFLLRMAALRWGWHLPVYKLREKH